MSDEPIRHTASLTQLAPPTTAASGFDLSTLNYRILKRHGASVAHTDAGLMRCASDILRAVQADACHNDRPLGIQGAEAHPLVLSGL